MTGEPDHIPPPEVESVLKTWRDLLPWCELEIEGAKTALAIYGLPEGDEAGSYWLAQLVGGKVLGILMLERTHVVFPGNEDGLEAALQDACRVVRTARMTVYVMRDTCPIACLTPDVRIDPLHDSARSFALSDFPRSSLIDRVNEAD